MLNHQYLAMGESWIMRYEGVLFDDSAIEIHN